MPIIQSGKTKEFVKVNKFLINSNLLKEIKEYCEWASVSIDSFFEQSAEFILKKDTEWKKFKKNKS